MQRIGRIEQKQSPQSNRLLKSFGAFVGFVFKPQLFSVTPHLRGKLTLWANIQRISVPRRFMKSRRDLA